MWSHAITHGAESRNLSFDFFDLSDYLYAYCTTKFISRGRIFITTSAWDRGTQVVSGIRPDVTTLT